MRSKANKNIKLVPEEEEDQEKGFEEEIDSLELDG
jgi:hypothetical protein